jgi:hypothetical protein
VANLKADVAQGGGEVLSRPRIVVDHQDAEKLEPVHFTA